MATPAATDITARAARIRLACFDVDGSLTDGRLIYLPGGGEAKAFHVHDGLGLRLLEECGVAVALVTARQVQVVDLRADDLKLSAVCQGVKDKAATVKQLADERGLALEQVAFFGDDLPDLPAIRLVGLAAGPADAHPWLAASLHWQSAQPGGRGAAREFCDLLLDAQGRREAVLARFGG